MRQVKQKKDVCGRTKDGKVYFQFAVRDPRSPGKWKTVHVSKKRLRAYGLEPSGRAGEIVENDARVLKRLVERGLLKAVDDLEKNREMGTTVSQLFADFLATKGRKNGKRTKDKKQKVFDLFVELFGDLPLRKVEVSHATGLLDHLERKLLKPDGSSFSANTVRDYYSYVKSAFDFGCTIGRVRANYFHLPELPAKVETTTPSWTPKEIAAGLKARYSDEHWDYVRWAVVGSFMLGLSPIEWSHADWSNFNAEDEALFIAKSKKKASSIRRTWVPIPRILLPAFLARQQDKGPIWPTYRGQRFTRSALGSLRRRVAAGWPDFDWLSLRKSASEFLQEQQIDALIIARFLRHQDAVPGGFRTLTKHYTNRTRNLVITKPVVDECFGKLEELARLALPTSYREGQLRLADPA